MVKVKSAAGGGNAGEASMTESVPFYHGGL